MFKRIALVGASIATMAGAALAAAGPANATAYVVWYGDAGYGYFESNGEHLYACDQKADGYGIRVDYYVEENRANAGSLRDSDGANGVCYTLNLSITEGHHLNFRTCIIQNGSTVDCTPYARVVA